MRKTLPLLFLSGLLLASCTIITPAPTPRPVQPVRPVQPMQPVQPVHTVQPVQPVQPAPSADEQVPKRFFLDFSDCYLVHEPATGVLQIAAEQMVLSYGSDMETRQLKPYLYHIRLKTWKGFYWKVNTSRKEAYKVDGVFGEMGGVENPIPGIRVEVVGGSDTQAPQRFLLRFSSSYLVYEPSSGTLQIPAELMVLSYGKDWDVQELKPYLYHLRLKTWKGFYWKVNTSRKEAYKVEGAFGSMGGQETPLKMGVRVVR